MSGIFTIISQAKLLTLEEINQTETLLSQEEGLDPLNAIVKVKPELDINTLMTVLSKFLGIPILDINAFNLDFMPKDVVSLEHIVNYNILPLAKTDKRLKLAITDPTNKEAFESITFNTGLALDLVLVNGADLTKLINQNSSNYFRTIVLNEGELEGVEFADDEPSNLDTVNAVDEDQPIVKFVHKMIFDAVQMGASDIHFEPYEKLYRVRYRVDGILREIATPPFAIKEKVTSRIKVVSKLDISEKRIPQDGRLRLALSKAQIIDFRVSTLPTQYGEKIVLRILDRKAASMGIESLGLEDFQQKALLNAIHQPYGIILVTGPTGSGKTVTLYTCLSLLNNTDKNISTAEDPIEIPLSGINQVAINEKAGMNFGVILRAFLRQDPDILMVGEIRDHDTAEIAIKAAQTGHLVLSTLHTNDAASALSRLVNMGIPSYNLGDTILLTLAQRLVRKLCPQCKTKENLSKEVLLKAGFNEGLVNKGFQPYAPVGCYLCHNTGYKGRIGIFEVIPVSDKIKELILNNASATELAHQAELEGVKNLRQSGILKIEQGVTSIAEVEANTSD